MASDRKTTVVFDTYGGTGGPGEIVRAAARLSRQGVAQVVLVGEVVYLQDQLGLLPYDPMTLRLVPAPVAYPRRPGDTLAQAEAAELALPIAMEMLAEGEADALVTASPPELVRDLADRHLGRLPGCAAVAAAAVVPTMPRQGKDEPLGLLLDVSGRRTTDAESLVQFAVLGATYARVVTKTPQPSVALLSTGQGAHDGPPEVVAAHERLTSLASVRFVGNLRATDLSRGFADVVVTDGLVGHNVLGLLEGLTEMTVEAARYAWKTKVTWRLGLRLLAQGVGMLRKVSEFTTYGGAPLLGLDRLVLVANPDSKEAAFANAIKLAARCRAADLHGQLTTAMAPFATGGQP
ncbi:MAG: hypothetical protein FJ100_01965 [Deltaproteobacteria bacterium]|nr:hypothetical protein [Deltaproteobacteria bacterium]